MPYIRQSKRKDIEDIVKLESFLEALEDYDLKSKLEVGDMNYIITKILHKYLHILHCIPNYQDYNTVIGLIECIKQEFYNKKVIPYEELKLNENGDL